MVRQLKYHEQKLLKKVDFLNVRLPQLFPEKKSLTQLHYGSGSKMPTSERSKSCGGIIFKTEKTITSV